MVPDAEKSTANERTVKSIMPERGVSERSRVEAVKPAKTPILGGKIPQTKDAKLGSTTLNSDTSGSTELGSELEPIEQKEVVGQLAVREQDGPKITPTDSDANLTGSRRITRQSMTGITGSEYSLTQHIHV